MDVERIKINATQGDAKACKISLREGCRRKDASLIAVALVGLHTAGEVIWACQWLTGDRAREIGSLREVLLAQLQDQPSVFANVHDLFGEQADWSLIPAGRFLMGVPLNEETRRFHIPPRNIQHEVEITRPFLMKRTLVTQVEWQTVIGNNPSSFQRESDGDTSDFPAETVSWYDALAFCNGLSQRMGVETCYDLSTATGRPGEVDPNSHDDRSKDGLFKVPGELDFSLDCEGYRLPTEAEWEYACLAGTSTETYGELDEIAWHRANSNWSNHPVGLKAPNAWGLYDMIGHVWEWVWDTYGYYPTTPQKDQKISDDSLTRVIRGSSWAPVSKYCNAFIRAEDIPVSRAPVQGFRVVRSLTTPTKM